MKKLVALLAVAATLAGCNISEFFQQKYYKDYYEPMAIPALEEALPSQHLIRGMTCYSYDNPYCQSASLQMIHSRTAEAQPIHFYNWIMGFTYGAYFHEYVGLGSFLPTNDPELGFIQAEDYLGYERRYHITDEAEVYQRAIKHLLAQDQPVRVALNSATLADEEGFYPHSILLVGYDEADVLYYETGGSDRVIPQHRGERVPWERLLAAVESVSKGFNYPWVYQLTDFHLTPERAVMDVESASLLQANGSSVVGDKYGPVATGTQAFQALAAYLSTHTPSESEARYLAQVLEMAMENRRDNADFLARSSLPVLQEVSKVFAQSGEEFQAAGHALEQGDYAALGDHLRTLAELEAKAGQRMIEHAQASKTQ